MMLSKIYFAALAVLIAALFLSMVRDTFYHLNDYYLVFEVEEATCIVRYDLFSRNMSCMQEVRSGK